MKTLRAVLLFLLATAAAQELQILPIVPGDDPPSVGIAQGTPTCLEFPSPPSGHALQDFRGRVLGEAERLCLQGTPGEKGALEVELEGQKWRFRLVKGEATLYQVRLLPPKKNPAPKAERPPVREETSSRPQAAPSPASQPAATEKTLMGATFRVVASLAQERGALFLDLLLVNRGTTPLVAEAPEARWSGKILSVRSGQASFSSGKRGWVPPGGSAILRLEVPLDQLPALPGLLEIIWPLTSIEAELSFQTAKAAFQIDWIPAIREVAQ